MMITPQPMAAAASRARLMRVVRLLRIGLIGLVALALLSAAGTARAASAPSPIEFSIASGDVDAESAILWAQGSTAGQIRFEVVRADEAVFASRLPVLTANVSDPLVPVKVKVSGLDAGTRYQVRVTEAATGAMLVGRFTTAAPIGKRAGLRFGVSGDWRQELLPYPAIRNVPERALDFFVALGDTIYADYPSPDVPAKQARTLDELRAKQHEAISERGGLNTWWIVRAATSLYAVIDDHEVTNDFAGGAPADSDRRFGGPGLIRETDLYRNGVQAFLDYYPIADQRYPAGDPKMAGAPDLYRYRTFGSDAALFMLDNRSFRDTELPDVPILQLTNKDAVAKYLTASFDAKRSMLGSAQFKRLLDDLQAAQSAGIRWKFILTPEPIQNLGVLNASDRWEGYAAERTALLRFITENKIANVVFITADFHGTIVNDVTYQDGPTSPNLSANGAWEIITGPVAFAEPFGPTVFGLANAAGLVKPEQAGLYALLPIAQKDAALAKLLNTQLDFYGYGHVGLDDPALKVKLQTGGWVAVHTYGWTEFDIDADTGLLQVTTYGIPWYDAATAAKNPAQIAAFVPQIVQQFTVEAR